MELTHISLLDPDGTLMELNSPLPRPEWSEELLEASRRYDKEQGEE